MQDFVLLKIQDTFTIFLAIIIEASPFIVLGTLVSIIITAFIKTEWLLKIKPKNVIVAHLVSSLLGLIFPVCECGNVPVARKLLQKGMTVSETISFYLGAPIINVVVISTTILAFSQSIEIVFFRIVGGLIIATSVGVIFSLVSNQKSMLTLETIEMCEHVIHTKGFRYIFSKDSVSKFIDEFSGMFKLLMIGAFIAALTQLWIPRDFIYLLNSSPILSILGMMLLAVILSVCSTVDAFIALGFVGQFSSSSIVAFLVFGPMIDLKAISMLMTTFTKRTVLHLVALVSIMTILLSLFVSIIGF